MPKVPQLYVIAFGIWYSGFSFRCAGASTSNVTHALTNQTTPPPQSHRVTEVATLRPSSTGTRQKCYESWMNWLLERESLVRARELFEASLASDPSKVRSRVIETLPAVFATIEKYGANQTYSTCDGIPRLHFSGTPNATSTRLFTLWYERHVSWDFVSPYNSGLPPLTGTVPGPNCHLEKEQCNDIRAANQRYWGVKGDPRAESIGQHGVVLACENHYDTCDLFMGNEVMILYWRPKLESRDVCGRNGAGYAKTIPYPTDVVVTTVTSAITFRGKDRYQIPYSIAGLKGWFNLTTWMKSNKIEESTLSGPFTFTSPYVYVAHRQIMMESVNNIDIFLRKPESNQNLRQVRRVLKGGVVRVRTEDISSVRALFENVPQGVEFAKLVAQGKFNPVRTGTSPDFYHSYDFWSKTTVPFDFGQVADPVPASAFYIARSNDCWLSQTHCGTITDDTYQPELFIRGIWSSILPSNITCRLPFMVDPPVALTRLEAPLRAPSLPTISHRPKPAENPDAHPTPPPSGESQADGGSHGRGDPRIQPGNGVHPPYPGPTKLPSFPLGGGELDDSGPFWTTYLWGLLHGPGGSRPSGADSPKHRQSQVFDSLLDLLGGQRGQGPDGPFWSGGFGSWLNWKPGSLGQKPGGGLGSGGSPEGKEGRNGRDSRNTGNVYAGKAAGRNIYDQWRWIVGLYMYALFIHVHVI